MRDALKRLSWISLVAALLLPWSARAENYSDIWWNPSESGWGITIADHETQLFAVWYTYESDGSPAWFVIPGGTFSADRRFFSGDLYRATGPSYAVPFDPSAVKLAKAGTASLDFAPAGAAAGSAIFTWTIGSTTRSRPIQRQPFGNAPSDWGRDYTDIWWNPSESGWGLTLAQHGNNVFGAWFTYGSSGQPLFVILPGVTFTAPGTFTGTLYTTTGPAYDGATFDPARVHVTAAGSATLRFSGDAGSFTSTLNGVTQVKEITRQPFGNARPASALGKRLLPARGVWASFDRRGWAAGYYSGELVRMLDRFDSELAQAVGAQNVSPTVGAEVSAQLDRMRDMGINTLSFEIRATDATYTGSFEPPTCNIPPVLGFLYPQPTDAELANLSRFLDLAQAHGMRVLLILNNTHMEEQPPTNASTWLGAIFRAVKDHPALDAFLVGGDRHVLANGGCGIPAEPPLWLGSTGYAGRYVQWAIGFGLAQGVAPRKLSAEAIVGDYFVEQQPGAGAEAQDRHLWSPLAVLKQIFDNVGIDPAQRTYAISFYAHSRCSNQGNFSLPCTDADPDSWADETARGIRAVVGDSRVVAAEWGNEARAGSGWSPSLAFESLTGIMARYGIEGGSYWMWTEVDSSSQADPARAGEPVRLRGLADVYNPVQRVLLDAYGFHLQSIPNGSFEEGQASPSGWTVEGNGTASRYRLADEAGQPVIRARGDYALRIVSGNGSNDGIAVTSQPIEVSAGTAYTTTANLRFRWTGDAAAGVSDPARPHVSLAIRYFKADGTASAIRDADELRLYQEDAPEGFGTFPVVYTTPADARWVRVSFGVARNGLAQAIRLDVDNVR